MCKLLKIAQDIWTVLQSLPSRERGLKYVKIFYQHRGLKGRSPRGSAD